MGRKQAPQPLSLAGESTNNTAATTSPGSGDGSHPYPKPTRTLTAPERPPLSAPLRPAAAAASSTNSASESTLHVVSPASTKSSPRSPFSKFNPSRKPQSSSPPHTADLTHPSHGQSEYFSRDPNDLTHKSSSAGLYPTSSATSQGSASHQRRQDDRDKHSRNGSRLFSFTKSSSRPHLHHNHTDNHADSAPRSTRRPATAQISRPTAADPSSIDPTNPKLAHPASLPIRTDSGGSTASDNQDHSNTLRRNKPKPFTLLNRQRSIKEKDGSSPNEVPGTSSSTPSAVPTSSTSTSSTTLRMMESDRSDLQQPLRTAPMQPEGQDRGFRHMMNTSNARTHSADRGNHHANKESRKEKEKDHSSHQHHHHGHQHSKNQSSTVRESSSSNFLSGLRSSGTRAVDMVSRNFFAKGNRSASTADSFSTVDDEHYSLKVINKPLIDQTRLTRISKRLEDSRDKTEFWMPAFPWRAIDYLNFKGCEVEGLYRVPGSAPQVKKWQRRFDEEYDVDLFAQDDLYDINIIGSMLKTWLRELPDELFPKQTQDRISRECAGSEEVPKMLIEELSNLPPFNYYLLFAITCHLSLLLAHSEKNKMDFRNLCICFQPCMKIDAFCFKFLVCDWRMCWQGCKNEAQYIEEEYKLFDQSPPPGLKTDSRQRSPYRNGAESPYNRSQSADSGRRRGQNEDQQPQNGKLRKKPATSQGNGSMPSTPANGSTSLTVDGNAGRNGGQDGPSLSPIKPLSPMNF